MLKLAALFFSALFVGVFMMWSGSAGAASTVSGAPVFAPISTEKVNTYVEHALALKLDERDEWHRLVHYRKRSFGRGWESEADNARFFLAPNGKFDPHAELIETLRQGFSGEVHPPPMPDSIEMNAICQFPARWTWLKQELRITDAELPKANCPRYEEFKAKVNPKSVTLVFSAYYVNNPSSAFGHLLLRLNHLPHGARGGKGSELLDYGVNYAANSDTGNALLYAFYGLAGFFPGTFTAMPYYYKVREYSDADSRDLWEYDLDLKQQEVQALVDHLWELGSTYFDYYYLTENCAYHLLAALEAAAPRLHLLNRIPFYVIPVDSVKAVVAEPGLVSHVTFRASTQRQLEARYATLTSEEKSLFLQIRNEPQPADAVKDLPAASAARILDTVLDDLDHRYFRELVFNEDSEAAARKQNVLLARSRLPSGGHIDVHVEESDRPDRSHNSGRWFLGAGGTRTAGVNEESVARTDTILDGELRFALHHFQDPIQGYLPYSSVEFWRMRARWTPAQNHAELREFALVTVSSLAPVSALAKNIAWRVSFGLQHVRDRRCEDCLTSYGLVNGGLSFAPAKPWLLYALTGPQLEGSPYFNLQRFTPEWSARAGLRLRFASSWELAAEGEWRRVFDLETFDRRMLNASLRWDAFTAIGAPYALEAEFTQEVSSQDFLFKYLRYF